MVRMFECREFLRNNSIVVLYDLETSGLDKKKDRIIQVSARRCFVTPDGLQEIDNYNQYINPGFLIDQRIEEKTGITNEFLADKPLETEVFEDIKNYFADYPTVGYNNFRFDDIFMANMYDRYKCHFTERQGLDVFRLMQDMLSTTEVPNYKLETITPIMFPDKQLQFHNAQDDTMATLLCVNEYWRRMNQIYSTVDMNTLLKPIVTRVTFWKNNRSGKGNHDKIYVNTNIGQDFYHDIPDEEHIWHINKGADEELVRYDLEYLFMQIKKIAGETPINEIRDTRYPE